MWCNNQEEAYAHTTRQTANTSKKDQQQARKYNRNFWKKHAVHHRSIEPPWSTISEASFSLSNRIGGFYFYLHEHPSRPSKYPAKQRWSFSYLSCKASCTGHLSFPSFPVQQIFVHTVAQGKRLRNGEQLRRGCRWHSWALHRATTCQHRCQSDHSWIFLASSECIKQGRSSTSSQKKNTNLWWLHICSNARVVL